jgi:hypothetical protein
MTQEQRLISFYNRQIMLSPKGSRERQEWIKIKREIENALQQQSA